MDFTVLNDFLDKSVDKYCLPALDVALTKGFETVFRYQHNCDNNSYFMGYSSTKVLVGAAAAKLIIEGKLSLDSPAGEFLPQLYDMNVYRRDESGMIVGTEKLSKDKPVLVKHLLTMTAGIADNISTEYIKSALASGKKSTQEIVAAILREPLSFEPGSCYKYGLCLDVAAALIEKVSGLSFSRYLEQNFFEPLDMGQASFHPTLEQRARLLKNHMWYEPGGYYYAIPEDNELVFSSEYESGGAGLYFTADDYIKFEIALANDGFGANGNRVLPKSAVDLMRRPMLSEKNHKIFQEFMGMPGYSYGLCVRTMQNPVVAGYTTPLGEFGWQGKAGTYSSICPEKQASIFMGIQICDYHPVNIVMHNELREMAYDLLG